jgi:hypothetical protein
MKIVGFFKVFEISETNGSLIPSFFLKNWNQQFFDSRIFKELKSMVFFKF